MSAKRDGRDVFVSGVDSLDRVKDVFRSGFGLRDDQMFVEGDPDDGYLAALNRGDAVMIYALDRRGDFGFKVDMSFAARIDESKFLDAVRASGVAIAYAVDETRADFAYHVATRHGVEPRELSFDDVDDDNYICNLV